MRAKLPDEEGFVDRDGVKLHYEVYGDGPETMVFVPPWSIVHSRVYKAQLPYFSERFRCITYDGRGNGKSDRPEDVAAYSLDNYVADALAVMDATRMPARRSWSAFPLVPCSPACWPRTTPERVKAPILAGTAASIGPSYPYMASRTISAAKHDASSRAGTNTIATTGSRTIPTLPNISSATSFPNRTRPSRSRMASTGRATPLAPVLAKTVEARTIPPAFDVSEAMYRKITLSRPDDPRRQRPHPALCSRATRRGGHRRRAGDRFQGGGHNPLGRIPGQVQRPDC